MAITAEMVKDLREKTGVGMMDCKKALAECQGDSEQAVAWLREKGLAKVAKKAGRATSEGLIASRVGAKAASLIELKCETDFVARSDKFQEFLKNVSAQVVDQGATDADALLAQPYAAEPGRTVLDVLNEVIAVLGENIQLGRVTRYELSGDGGFGAYIHSNGKIGVLVEFKAPAGAAEKPAFQDLAKSVAMQVAAANPICVTSAEVPADLLAQEKEIYKNQAMEEGKPENIAEKIVLGRVQKYYKDVCLVDQPYIKDDSKSIGQLLKEVGKDLGGGVEIVRFTRLALGEEA